MSYTKDAVINRMNNVKVFNRTHLVQWAGGLGLRVAKEDMIDAPMWWHTKGLQQTATGYGCKFATHYKILYQRQLGSIPIALRVYCTCFSNSGTCWVRLRLARGEQPTYIRII